MQIVSFRPAGSRLGLRAGFSDGSRVIGSAHLGYPDSVRELLAGHAAELPSILEKAAEALESDPQAADVATVHVGPAVPDPDKILCIGLNYREHADESQMGVGEFPPVFAKFRNSLIGATDDIVMPGISTQIDYEVELAVVISRTCKNVAIENALDHVAGYAVFNDVSARDVQLRNSQWTPGKMIDTFGPLGPGITIKEYVADVQDLHISTRVNGHTMQDSTTAKMIWPVAETVSYLSAILTLEPGDVIATGTPAGVGLAQDPPLWLQEGDVVEVEVESLGVLRNTVIAPIAPAAAG